MTQIFNFDTVEQLFANLKGDARIAERNRMTDAIFEEGVSRAGWRRLHPGDRLQIPSRGRLVVLGVVVWNAGDRDILNIAAEQISDPGSVAVFDLDDVHSPDDLQAFMPFVAMPLQTPTAAEYRDGHLVRHAVGPDVQVLIRALADQSA